MIRKFLNFILIVFSAIVVASFYGILHDQITYTISNEYYTLFKFEQFGINHWGIPNQRIKVGIIGFLATWWVGLLLGIIYGITSCFFNVNKVWHIAIKSIFINICFAIVFGIFGYIYSDLCLTMENFKEVLPSQTKDIQSFINVGSIHNFGYFGAFIGLIAGVYLQIINSKIVQSIRV